MKIARILASLSAALLVTTQILAEDKSMAPPKPAAEMSQLSYLAGTWNCSGKAFASPFGPEHASEGVAHAKASLGGFWYEMHYDETKSATNPAPYHIIQLMGYDPVQKVFLSHCFDMMGGACSQTSPGWKGDTLAFEGTDLVMGQKTGARDSFTKLSATEMKHHGEIQTPDGAWVPTDEETCHRADKTAKK
jgi:hypothetical protein